MALTQVSTQGIKDGTITGTDLATNVDLVDNQFLRIGNSQDLQIHHDGSNSFIKDTGIGDLLICANQMRIKNAANNETMAIFTENGRVQLWYDNSAKFETTSGGVSVTGGLITTGNIDAGTANFLTDDNGKFISGTAGDLQIYHDGSHSYALNTTGNFFIGSTSVDIGDEGASKYSARFDADDSADLYYNNSKKFETTSSGATVTGTLVSDGLIIGDSDELRIGDSTDFSIYHSTDTTLSNITGDLKIYNVGTNSDDILVRAKDDIRLEVQSGDTAIACIGDGAVELYHNNSKKFETTSSGVTVSGDNSTGSILKGVTRFTPNDSTTVKVMWDETGFSGAGHFQVKDGVAFTAGNSSDLKIFHDGTTNKITLGGKELRILGGGSNDKRIFVANTFNAAELYYDNVKKLETDSIGVKLEDNNHVSFGTGSDFKIHFDGSDAYLDASAGNVYFRGNSNEAMLQLHQNGGVHLYYNNSKMFETTADGATLQKGLTVKGVEGGEAQIRIEADEADNASDRFRLVATDSAGFHIQSYDGSQYDTLFKGVINGSVELYHNGSKKFETTSKGIKVEGGQANGELGVFHATGSTFQSCTLQSVASRNTTNHTYLHFKCSINGIADKMHVRDSGDIRNTNNSYGSISDISLKENIVDAGSQWNDIKNIKVRKFNFKSLTDPDQKTMLGVVAQEAELVCPGLVTSEVSLQEGEEKEYKSFKYSVLYMKAIKCLQEAMVKIETLETEVAALKAA